MALYSSGSIRENVQYVAIIDCGVVLRAHPFPRYPSIGIIFNSTHSFLLFKTKIRA